MVSNPKPKPKPVRLIDIAAKAGVSRSAVASVVLQSAGKHVRVSEDTARRIRGVAQELGYAPNASAQRLAGKRAMLIGVIIDSYAPTQRFSQLAEIERAADSFGYRVMVGQSHGEIDKIRAYAADFIANRVDGAICVSHHYPTVGQQVAEAFLKVPNVVYLGQPLLGEQRATWVAVDHREASRQLVEHLHAQGRTRIGLCLADPRYRDVQERRDGFLAGLESSGLEVDDDRIFHSPPPTRDGAESWHDQATAKRVATLARRGRLDAVLAINDIQAMALIRHLKANDLSVPEQVAVVGYDNLPMAAVTLPSITSVDLRISEVARRGFDLLRRRIDGEALTDKEKRVLLTPRLIARESG